MLTSDEILDALKDRGVKHAQIADALGVATNNATRLYNPDPKTGKKRRLAYDEGVKLIEVFKLDEPAQPETLQPLSRPVAALAVRYIAMRMGVPEDRQAELVPELAADIEAFSAFASEPHRRQSESHVEGFFAGRHPQAFRG